MNFHRHDPGNHPKFQERLLDRRGILALDPADWDRLARNALVENPFYDRRYVLAGLDSVDGELELRASAIWSPDGELVGLFPFVHMLGAACAAWSLYQFSSTPLIHREHATSAVRAWLISVANGQAPAIWRFRDLALESPLFERMAETAASLKLQLHLANTYARPRLTRRPAGFDQHASSVLSKNRRKGLERNLRRLGELGALRFERARLPELVEERVEQFLKMEHAGWKGKAGTAFLCTPKWTAFARAAFRARSGDSHFTSIDALLLNERPVALTINIASGKVAFTPKCTYDEELRRCSPGLVLDYLALKHFYADDLYAEMDAATTVDGSVVEGLWNETSRMGEVVIGKAPLARIAATLLGARAKAKRLAKRTLAWAQKARAAEPGRALR